jgi:hypothetical protein
MITIMVLFVIYSTMRSVDSFNMDEMMRTQQTADDSIEEMRLYLLQSRQDIKLIVFLLILIILLLAAISDILVKV